MTTAEPLVHVPMPRAPFAVVTVKCPGCHTIHIHDLAWRHASTEQQQAWADNGLGPRNGACGVCTTADEAVIERVTAELAATVAAHLAGERTDLLRSRHPGDIRTGDTSGLWDIINATYGASPGEWRHQSACIGADSTVFAVTRNELANAKLMCGWCPVRAQCLEYALTNPESSSAGVWGGLHQKALKAARLAVKHEAYRRNGVKVGSFGTPEPDTTS